MIIRDIRQSEFATLFLNSDRKGILNICPRAGKCKIAINILNELRPKNILVCYPDLKIEQSWRNDFEKFNYSHPNVTFTTHLSLKKFIDNEYDIVIIDEVHLLSEAQIETCKELFVRNKTVLALTGTLAPDTRKTLYFELNLPVIAEYSIEQAVEENVVSDFEIHIIQIPLDNKTRIKYGNKFKTEKQRFDGFSYVIDKLEKEGRDTFYMRLNRMRVIQNSIAKRAKTIELLKQYSNERVLVFCGLKKIADSLGIPSFHSETKDKTLLQDFAEGRGNHLAVVRIGNSGVTYTPLNRIIINYFDSNEENLIQKLFRALTFDYNTPDKKAIITIITTNEPTELKWLNKALNKINKDRIIWDN